MQELITEEVEAQELITEEVEAHTMVRLKDNHTPG